MLASAFVKGMTWYFSPFLFVPSERQLRFLKSIFLSYCWLWLPKCSRSYRLWCHSHVCDSIPMDMPLRVSANRCFIRRAVVLRFRVPFLSFVARNGCITACNSQFARAQTLSSNILLEIHARVRPFLIDDRWPVFSRCFENFVERLWNK